ncbi:hypothetical protein [Streptomyces hygroscopicus]|uniref:hypothetical protein n=1 Tax=Streptomyces hygroscopicus TaxID=1912 RepID=UPI00223FE1EF|nr:hypothetical protein [Streptomyces hygroscopicus]
MKKLCSTTPCSGNAESRAVPKAARSRFQPSGFLAGEGRDTVVLTDNTADEAAVFIAWLRDAFLPSPDLIRFSSEPAVEAGIETDWRMPAGGDTARIAGELKHHIEVIER